MSKNIVYFPTGGAYAPYAPCMSTPLGTELAINGKIKGNWNFLMRMGGNRNSL